MSQARLVDVSHDTLPAAFIWARSVRGRRCYRDDEPDLASTGSQIGEYVCSSPQKPGEAFGRNVTEQLGTEPATPPPLEKKAPHRYHQSSIKGDEPC
ncbi:hypothetical protein MCERH10_01266 [Caulobacteraceae bacterium]